MKGSPKISVLIVDDDEVDTELFAAEFSQALEDTRRKFLPTEIEITTHVFLPDLPESFSEFKHRLVDYLSGKRVEGLPDPATVKVVIFDYQIALVGDREIDMFDNSGASLAHHVRQKRPDIVRALRTQFDPEDVRVDDSQLFDIRVVKRHSASNEQRRDLARRILKRVADLFATPFWDALSDFAQTPKVVMHALAISDAEIIKSSWTLKDVLDFYSINYFRAEASGTQKPLASVFNPGSGTSLSDALRNFRMVFGSDGVFFSTGGTSTTNKILYQAFCQKGDWVLVDRNCHISHHYAIAMSGAKVCYVDPAKSLVTGKAIAATPWQFADTLDQMLASGCAPPRVICTTNCTFDGVIVDVEELIRSVHAVFRKHNKETVFEQTVFLIDEAWFGFARFHPDLSELSAMQVAGRLRADPNFGSNARVYATTSVHKTMFGFRQSSVLLASDKKMSSTMLGQTETNSEGAKINRAIYAFTTTSPHLGILASLDLCARHMWFEGMPSIAEAIDSSNYFRDRLVSGLSQRETPMAQYYELEEDSVEPFKEFGVIMRDPTKVTLKSRAGLSGAHMRDALWEFGKVQVNKFGGDDVLLMFMPGFQRAKASELLQGMTRVVTDDSRFRNVQDVSAPKKNKKVAVEDLPTANTLLIDIGGYLFNPPKNRKQHLFELCDDSFALLEGEYDWFASDFVSPYPPGYPVLVPGEKITSAALHTLIGRLSTEIHGVVKQGAGSFIYAFKAKKKLP